ncbi:MAG: prepilin-type N-terminal cleavage/methylation domain-containing protein [Proteobacteria bacterium]|nr:prepilin-type N-terminal cleavage/methylation domain-containing protein [Pseudomonadota bacterium]
MNSLNNKTKTAFSLLEMSVVLVVIAVLFGAVYQVRSVIHTSRLTAARSLTVNSPVAEISGLSLWLESTMEDSFDDYDALNDGDAISTWYDLNPQSAVSHDFTAVNAPTYVKTSSIANNLPVMQFDGSNDYMQNTSFQDLIGVNDYIIFLVMSNDITSTNGIILINDTGTNAGAGIYVETSTSYRFLHRMPYGSSGGDSLSVGSVSTNGLKILRFERSLTDSTQEIFLNGTSIGSMATSSVALGSGGGNFILGTLSLGVRQFDGNIAEIIIYKRSLSTNQKNDVENYLSQKWGIEI